MTKNEILKKIGIIIIELREQYDLTQLNRDDINDIELELFVANAHFLTDHIEILRKLNNQEAKIFRDRQMQEPTYFEPLVKTAIPEKKQQVLNLHEEEHTTIIEPEEPFIEPLQSEEIHKPVIIRHELILDEQPVNTEPYEAPIEEEWVNEETAEIEDEEQQYVETEPEAEAIEEPIAEIPAEPEVTIPEPELIIPEPEIIHTQIIVNEVDDDKPLITINQILSAQVTQHTGSQLQPITDLKSAITLNDKLLFVRDLFNGYSMAYSEAIEIVNRLNRFEEADQFLKLNYYTKNAWEAKQATTDKFYELLHRRFPA